MNCSSDGLEFALACLVRNGTNDLLPKSPFTNALQADWHHLKALLLQIDLTNHVPASPRRIYAPKSATSFRVSHDIDPLDFLLLTAIVYDLGPKIEQSRDGYFHKRVFSNRFEPSQSGSLFKAATYEDFRITNLETAKGLKDGYVVAADLTDCYNQISTHRVANGLIEAGIDKSSAKAIEELLLSLNIRSSRGLTIGQDFSRLLAESAIKLIDDDLIYKGAKYTRYVDDFRFFCKDYGQALRCLHYFVQLLNQDTLKLILNDEKTKVFKVETFLQLESVDPEKREESERYKRYKSKVKDALDWIESQWEDDYTDPPEEEDDLDDATRADADEKALAESIIKLFDEAILNDPPDFQIARHLLIKCTHRKRNLLIGRVINSLERLAPVLGLSVRYLKAVSNSFSPVQRQALYEYCTGGPKSFLPFTREWLADLVVDKPDVLPVGKTQELLRSWGDQSFHFKMMAAIVADSPPAIRQYKQEWKSLSRRDRHWLIFASKVLPPPERTALWKEVSNSGDPIELCIVAYLKGLA